MVLGIFEQDEDYSSLKSVDPDKFPKNVEHAITKAHEYAVNDKIISSFTHLL